MPFRPSAAEFDGYRFDGSESTDDVAPHISSDGQRYEADADSNLNSDKRGYENEARSGRANNGRGIKGADKEINDNSIIDARNATKHEDPDSSTAILDTLRQLQALIEKVEFENRELHDSLRQLTERVSDLESGIALKHNASNWRNKKDIDGQNKSENGQKKEKNRAKSTDASDEGGRMDKKKANKATKTSGNNPLPQKNNQEVTYGALLKAVQNVNKDNYKNVKKMLEGFIANRKKQEDKDKYSAFCYYSLGNIYKIYEKDYSKAAKQYLLAYRVDKKSSYAQSSLISLVDVLYRNKQYSGLCATITKIYADYGNIGQTTREKLNKFSNDAGCR